MTDNRPIDLDIEGLEDPVEIGVGGFATVFKAYQPAFRRTVAVKVLATLNLDDAARERFERECQAMGSLSEHPNIVTVYGAGFTTSGRPYLVMAYLPGGSLQERIDEAGAIPWQDATLYGVHLAGALETAHRAQVVHRDIKPANVLMSTFGDAQLTDFGIARISGGHETRSGVITASMAHAPPEVLDGQRPTISADVYSLGSTIFELIYGQPAFARDDDESMVPMLRRILTDPPPDLRQRGVPDQVCQVIERAMAKDPAARQPSAVELGRELQAARRALGVEAGKLTVPADVSVDVEPGHEISFVAAPSQMLCANCHSEIPVGADVCPSCGTPVGSAPVAAAPGPGIVTPAGAAPVAAAAGYGAPPSPSAGAAPPGYGAPPVQPYAAPASAPVEKKRSAGLLVGVGVLVVILLALVAFVVVKATSKNEQVASDPNSTLPASTSSSASTSSTSSSSTSSSTSSSIEPTTPVTGYTPELEAAFIESCLKNQGNTRPFCRCVFTAIKTEIPYDRFKQIDDALKADPKAKAPEIEKIIADCSTKTGGGASTTN